ncbi:hypothetical protein H8E77_30880 [bacterium]|nr:hypothetical protein [bacterium]
MKKLLVLIVIFAFAVPAMAADLDEYVETIFIQPFHILAPGGTFIDSSNLSTGWPPDMDAWLIWCSGGGTLNITVADLNVQNTIFGILWQSGVGFVDANRCLTPCTFTLTANVPATGGFFIAFIGYSGGGNGYDILGSLQ